MRDEFEKLVSRLYNTGLGNALCRTESVEDLKDLWKFFLETNRLLIIEAEDWKDKFVKKADKPIFKAYEEPKHPLEVAILIYIMDISVEDLCWNSEGLKSALKKECRVFSYAVAILMGKKPIKEITAEDIMSLK